ncbi:MAG: ribose 5-phosphate isomerase A [Acidimicrobiales bacterium]|jgi:ribose 5-phosphate isomerase A
MHWNAAESDHPEWPTTIENYDAKARVAGQAAERLHDGDVVGVGSGSTSLLALHALVDTARAQTWHFSAITTSLEMAIACGELSVPTTSLLQARPDWSFDGADEVDGDLNMIKGRGGAMLREKLLLASSPERYILIDESKRVTTLGERAPVPVEVIPEALQLVQSQLLEGFDVREIELRMAVAKDGPVITEHGNVILEVRFAEITSELDTRLNSVPGVVGSGLFFGFRPSVISA